jgi:lipopolysaccharide cholinephosphotransferase
MDISKRYSKYRNKKTKLFCNFMGKAVFKNAMYPKEYFTPTEYVPFEKVQLRAPVKLNEFLSNRFGDYMTPPSPDRIKWDQHAEKWDTAHDFRTVDGVRCTEHFEDEKKLI